MKLTYFDMDGGRGEPLRLALAISEVDFEDHRISFPEFGQIRSELPFRAVPVVGLNGGQYTQSNALTRYYGRVTGLYPEDPWQAYLCDEITEAIEDATHFTVRTFGLKDQELQDARRQLVEDRFVPYLKSLALRLENAGGGYFSDNRLTIADLKVFVWVATLNRGVLDHVPTDLVARTAPIIQQHYERIGSNPRIKAYYENRNAAQ